LGQLLAGCSFANHSARCDALLAQAHDAAARKEFARAQDILKLAADEAEKSDKAFHVPDVLKEQTNVAFAQERYDDALAYAKRLQSAYDEMLAREHQRSARQQIVEDRTRISTLLGDCLIKEDRKEEALQVFKKASDDLKEIGGDITLQTITSQHYNNLLKELHQINLGDDVEAMGEHYEVRRKILKAHGLFKSRDFKRAIPAYKETQQACKSSAEDDSYVDATVELAMCELLVGDFTAARQDAQLAIAKMGSSSVPRHSKARAWALRALTEPEGSHTQDLLTKVKETDPATAISTLELMAALARDPSLRERVYLLIWNLPSRKSGDITHDTILGLGAAFSEERKFDEGIRFFEHQRESSHWLTNIEKADCLEAEATIMEAAGRNSDSKEVRLKALKIRKSTAPENAFAKYMNMAGLVADYAKLGKVEQSISLGSAVLADPAINETTQKTAKMEIELALARDYKGVHNFAKSLAMYDSMILPLKKHHHPGLAELSKERDEVARLCKKPDSQEGE
jgi:tetratricopeptide (TPR) repeat protein